MLANINHKKSYCHISTRSADGRGHRGFDLDLDGRKREQQGNIRDVQYGRLPALFCLFQRCWAIVIGICCQMFVIKVFYFNLHVHG